MFIADIYLISEPRGMESVLDKNLVAESSALDWITPPGPN